MSRSRNNWQGESAPSGHWHPGMGSRPADKGYAGPGGMFEGEQVHACPPEAGHSVPRKDTQAADPTIDDKMNRRNVQLHPQSERYGPAGVIQYGRVYEDSHTDTGRNVRILPSAKGNTDARRIGGM